MHVWPLHEAKAKLTALIASAKDAPQIISRHGAPETVVLSMEHYCALVGSEENLVSFFSHSPLYGMTLYCERDPSPMRVIEL